MLNDSLSMTTSWARTVALVLFFFVLQSTSYAVGNDQAKIRNSKITTVVIHAIGGPRCTNNKVEFTGAPGDAKRWIDFFENSESVGIHYVIDRQGNVEAGIDENRVAWHAKGNNSNSIGIELVNNGDGQEEYPAEQVEALVNLVKEIRLRHDDIANIVRHSDIDHSTFSCGGLEEARKRDPGPKFPFDEFLASVSIQADATGSIPGTEYVPLGEVAPVCSHRKFEGRMLIQFDITESGSVSNYQELARSRPLAVVARRCVYAAVMKLRFRPFAVSGVRTVVDFKPTGGQIGVPTTRAVSLSSDLPGIN